MHNCEVTSAVTPIARAVSSAANLCDAAMRLEISEITQTLAQ